MTPNKKIKDLEFFKDQVAKEYTSSGKIYTSWANMWQSLLWDAPGGVKVIAARALQNLCNEAAERYASYLASIALNRVITKKKKAFKWITLITINY